MHCYWQYGSSWWPGTTQHQKAQPAPPHGVRAAIHGVTRLPPGRHIKQALHEVNASGHSASAEAVRIRNTHGLRPLKEPTMISCALQGGEHP